MYGDQVEALQRVTVHVPLSGGNAAVSCLGAIAGVLVNRSSSLPLRQENVEVVLEQTDQTKTSGGRSTPLTVITDARGAYVIDSLGLGIYQLRVRTGSYSGSLTISDTLA